MRSSSTTLVPTSTAATVPPSLDPPTTFVPPRPPPDVLLTDKDAAGFAPSRQGRHRIRSFPTRPPPDSLLPDNTPTSAPQGTMEKSLTSLSVGARKCGPAYSLVPGASGLPCCSSPPHSDNEPHQQVVEVKMRGRRRLERTSSIDNNSVLGAFFCSSECKILELNLALQHLNLF